LIGIIIRLQVYVHNRSFFIDEANLARNIIEKPIDGYFSSLNYEQYAPPLFLVETKLMTALFGKRDYIFRIIPLLSGIGTLILLFLILRNWVPESSIGLCYSLALICFSTLFIRYHTEFKQYSSDALVALLLLYLAWKEKDTQRFDKYQLLLWLIWGAVGLWYSMSLVFILPAIFCCFYYWTKDKQLIWLVLGWGSSLALFYLILLRTDVGDSNIQNHFDQYFFSANVFSAVAWKHNFLLFADILKQLTDKTAISIGLAVLLLVSGYWTLFNEHKAKFMMTFLPLCLLILASILRVYPCAPRLILFILPILLIVVCYGANALWSYSNVIVRVGLAVLLILSVVNKKGYRHLYEKMEFEDVKSAMEKLVEAKPTNEPLWVHHEAVPAFLFYNNLSEQAYDIKGYKLGHWELPVSEYMQPNNAKTLQWLMFAHTPTSEVKKLVSTIDSSYKLIKIYQFERAALLEFSFE